MPDFEHLPRAPITEAVLAVQVRARANLAASVFKELAAELQPEFPVVENQSSVDGYRFWSADRLDLAQFRVDGFALNRLKPYMGWDRWFPTFRRLWALYSRVAAPLSALRVSARCINQVPVMPNESLEHYLTAPPHVPDGLPNTLVGFLTRVDVTDAGDPSRSVSMVQGLQVGAAGPQILLDVDAYSAGDFPVDAVIGAFDALHELRNRAFFNSFTREARAQFR